MKNKVWVVGHRGAMAYAPENTRASFERGYRAGADAVECDVHLSRDGEVVVIHDPTLDRTTSGKGRVRARDWREMSRLDAGRWFSPRYRGQKLWRLADLLRWARPKRSARGEPFRLVIEIKRGPYPGISRKVAEAVRAAAMEERTVVISFNHSFARQIKTYSNISTGLLFAKPLRGLARRMAWARADAIFPLHRLVTPALAAQAKRRGWWMGSWTVNDAGEMRRLAKLGVCAIASNIPDRMREALVR